MSDADKPQDAPFDFDKLVQLVKLMETHGLTEVSLRRGEQKWTLRRGVEPGANAVGGERVLSRLQTRSQRLLTLGNRHLAARTGRRHDHH